MLTRQCKISGVQLLLGIGLVVNRKLGFVQVELQLSELVYCDYLEGLISTVLEGEIFEVSLWKMYDILPTLLQFMNGLFGTDNSDRIITPMSSFNCQKVLLFSRSMSHDKLITALSFNNVVLRPWVFIQSEIQIRTVHVVVRQ